MYVEDELWDWIDRRCTRAHRYLSYRLLDEILEECGIWYSFEGIKHETEDFDMTLEECCREYWYIIDGDKLKFTNQESFADNLDEYLGL